MIKQIIFFALFFIAVQYSLAQDVPELFNACINRILTDDDLTLTIDVQLYDKKDTSTPLDQSIFTIVRDKNGLYTKVPGLEMIENKKEQWRIYHKSKTIIYGSPQKNEKQLISEMMTTAFDSLTQERYEVYVDTIDDQCTIRLTDKESKAEVGEIIINVDKKEIVRVIQHVPTTMLIDREYVQPVLQMTYSYAPSEPRLRSRAIAARQGDKMKLKSAYHDYELIQNKSIQ